MTPADRVESSVVNLAALLRQVITEGHLAFAPSLTEDVLRSQAKLAKFELVDRRIYGTSLNTLKAAANRVLLGGFSELDDVRRAALLVFQRMDQDPEALRRRRSKGALERKIAALEQAKKGLEQDLWHVSTAFEAALRRARSVIKDSNRPDLIARFAHEEAELRARVSLVHRQLGQSVSDAGYV